MKRRTASVGVAGETASAQVESSEERLRPTQPSILQLLGLSCIDYRNFNGRRTGSLPTADVWPTEPCWFRHLCQLLVMRND